MQLLERAQRAVEKYGSALAEIKRQQTPKIDGLELPKPLNNPDTGGEDTATPRTPRTPKGPSFEDIVGNINADIVQNRILDEQIKKQNQINDARIAGNEELAKELERAKALIPVNEQLRALEEFKQGVIEGQDKLLKGGIPQSEIDDELKKIDLAIDNKFKELRKAQGEAEAQEITKTQAVAKAREDALRPLEEQRQLLDAKLNGTEKQVRLELEAQRISAASTKLTKDEVLEILKVNDALQGAVDKMEELQAAEEAFREGVETRLKTAMEDALVNTIEAAVSGAEDLGKALQDIAASLLKDIGRMFISKAIGGIEIPGFADGGRPQVGQYSLVGEEGPELVKFDQAATVYSNTDSKAMASAMARYSNANSMDSGSAGTASGGSEGVEGSSPNFPINVTTGPVMRFNNEDYVSQSDFQRGLTEAAAQGAKMGEARTLGRLRGSATTRRKIGI